MSQIRKYQFHCIIAILIAIRFFHFDNTIDRPHAWRQHDTKQYIDSYYTDDKPFNKPSVCWMGGHETVILEFPLPEYLISKLYHVLGNSTWVARTFFLLFFIASIYYLYASLKLIFKNQIPSIATIIYASTPLSLFYSRAIHIDFSVLFFE